MHAEHFVRNKANGCDSLRNSKEIIAADENVHVLCRPDRSFVDVTYPNGNRVATHHGVRNTVGFERRSGFSQQLLDSLDSHHLSLKA